MAAVTNIYYNCNQQISIYDGKCGHCSAVHEPQQRVETVPQFESIDAWLEALDLANYLTNFEENAVTLTLLPDLSDDDLKSIGID